MPNRPNDSFLLHFVINYIGDFVAKAVIDFHERQDRVLTIVKGKYGLGNKSEAANLIVSKFEDAFLEPELRPEYKEEILKVDRGKFEKFSSVKGLRAALEDA